MAIKSPPGLVPLSHLSGGGLLTYLRFNRVTDEKGRYLPFDELQYRIEEGKNVDTARTLTRLTHNAAIQRTNYCSGVSEQAGFSITPVIAEACELVSKRATALTLKDQTERLHGTRAELNQLRLEEPITSSQLESANTTTLVTRKMLGAGRSPRTEDEHMVAGNARLMAEIPHLLAEPLTPTLTRQLHAVGMGGISNAKYRPGEFRETGDVVIVNYDGNIMHQPSVTALLSKRLEKVCQWLNSHEGYIHPLVRACTLHFMLAHEYPFRDGNGRTSRALFYWYMLKSGYGVFKYISINNLLHTVLVEYAASYQYTKSDGIGLTYFPEYQVDVIKHALQNWQQHVDEIIQRNARLDSMLFSSGVLRRPNPRQIALLNMMLANPRKEYTIAEISMSLSVSDNTARTDLRTIAKKGFAQEKRTNNQQAVYIAHYPLQLLPVNL